LGEGLSKQSPERRDLETPRVGVISGRRNFHTLRHTFRTVVDGAKDQPAADHIMGHEVEHKSSVYRETISDEWLKAVSDHVREWLFANEEPETALLTMSKHRANIIAHQVSPNVSAMTPEVLVGHSPVRAKWLSAQARICLTESRRGRARSRDGRRFLGGVVSNFMAVFLFSEGVPLSKVACDPDDSINDSARRGWWPHCRKADRYCSPPQVTPAEVRETAPVVAICGRGVSVPSAAIAPLAC
jgi:hypothetical protein